MTEKYAAGKNLANTIYSLPSRMGDLKKGLNFDFGNLRLFFGITCFQIECKFEI